MYENFKNHLLQLIQICVLFPFLIGTLIYFYVRIRLMWIYMDLLREKPIWHACDAIARLCKGTYLFLRYSSSRARWPKSIVVPGTASIVTSRYVTSSERNVERGWLATGACASLSPPFSSMGAEQERIFSVYSINTFNFTQYKNTLSSNIKLYCIK